MAGKQAWDNARKNTTMLDSWSVNQVRALSEADLAIVTGKVPELTEVSSVKQTVAMLNADTTKLDGTDVCRVRTTWGGDQVQLSARTSSTKPTSSSSSDDGLPFGAEAANFTRAPVTDIDANQFLFDEIFDLSEAVEKKEVELQQKEVELQRARSRSRGRRRLLEAKAKKLEDMAAALFREAVQIRQVLGDEPMTSQ